MSICKYPAISIDIEKKISGGYYFNRIPPVSELVREYGSSRQTIVNALKPLIDKKLIAAGPNGTRINRRYRRRRKLIGIVLPISADIMLHEPEITNLAAQIQADGHEIIMLDITNCRFSPNIKNVFGPHFDGLIFTYSSLSVEIATYLNKRKIPFVSCNRLPVYPHLNFVDYDSLNVIRTLAQHLQQAGYRDIGLFFPGRLEGYNDMVRSCWKNIKKEMNLPPTGSDDFAYNWQASHKDSLINFIELIKRKNCWPQALIFWYNLSMSFDIMKKAVPPDCLLVTVETEPLDPPLENCVFIRKLDYGKLFSEAYELLQEIMIAPTSQAIRRCVDGKVIFLQQIPKLPDEREFESHDIKNKKFHHRKETITTGRKK